MIAVRAGHENAHPHVALAHGANQGPPGAAVGHEVGSGDVDALRGAFNQRLKQDPGSRRTLARSAAHEQTAAAVPRFRAWEVVRTGNHFTGLFQPVFRKDGVQAGGRGALQTQDGIAPRKPLLILQHPVVGESGSSDESGPSIHHEHLAMRPVIHFGPVFPIQRMVPADMPAGRGEGTQVLPVRAPVSNRIDNQPHLNPGPRPVAKHLDELPRHFAFEKFIGFQVYRALGCFCRLQFGGVEPLAVIEHGDSRSAANRRIRNSREEFQELHGVQRAQQSWTDVIRLCRSEQTGGQPPSVEDKRPRAYCRQTEGDAGCSGFVLFHLSVIAATAGPPSGTHNYGGQWY